MPIPRPAHLVALTAAVCLAAACGRGGSRPAAPPQASANTWATVDGREITRDDVEKAYRRTAQATAPSEEEALTVKLNLLNEMIVQDILLAKAQELKVEVADTEIDQADAERKKSIPPEALQQELTRRNITAADMREGLRREMIAAKVLEREVTDKVIVSDQEVTDFFNANRAQFNLAEDAYRIAQIVITPVRDEQLNNRTGDDATTAEAAARKAQSLMGRLKGGESFGELAADYSEDPQTAPRGGDLGLVPASALRQVPPQLRDAVLKAEPGMVNVVSGGGVHTLVLLVGKEAAGQRDLNTPGVRDGITNSLKARKEQLLRTAYLTNLRSDAQVVNYIARRVLESPGKLPTLDLKGPGAQ